jgi:hypothetical protein
VTFFSEVSSRIPLPSGTAMRTQLRPAFLAGGIRFVDNFVSARGQSLSVSISAGLALSVDYQNCLGHAVSQRQFRALRLTRLGRDVITYP